MRSQILRLGLLMLVSLLFALPIIAQDEPSPLLDLLANPPEDGLLIVEIDMPGFSINLFYMVINVSTGKYYYLEDTVPQRIDRMPFSYQGKLIVTTNFEGLKEYYVIENRQVKKLSLPENSRVLIDRELQWTPNGQLSFVGHSLNESDTDIYIWDGVTLQNISQNDENDSSLLWSFDGKLAFTSGNEGSNTAVFVWDRIIIQKIRQHGYAAAWSPDGRLAIHSEGGIYVWDGTNVLNVPNTPNPHYVYGWSSDGKLAFDSAQGFNGEIYVWDGQQINNVSQNSADDRHAVWGPDNQLAFVRYASENHLNQIYVWENGVLTQPIAEEVWPPISWNADGRLAFAVPRKSGLYIYTWDGQNTSLITILPPSIDFREIMWVDAP